MTEIRQILHTATFVFIFLIGDGFFLNSLSAQTCSCAGAPLVSAQSLGSTEPGNLVFGVTANFNNINKLYSGTSELNNRSAERSTFTTLIEANYGISDRFTVTGTFSYVRKERVTGLQTGTSQQQLFASGIGDAVLMLKYDVIEQSLWKPYHFAIGSGTKIPLATNSLTSNGLALNADMQLGTGSWDGVVWTFFSYTIRSQNINIFTANSFKLTSKAERFNENDNYKFGNEINSMLGITGPAFNRFFYNLRLKYRYATSDSRNGSNLPSTGGEWLNFEPGIGAQLSDRFSLQVSGEIPLYRNVNGTQPSTTYILSASLFFSLNKSEGGFNLGLPGK